MKKEMLLKKHWRSWLLKICLLTEDHWKNRLFNRHKNQRIIKKVIKTSLPDITKKELLGFLKEIDEHPLPTDLLDYIEGKAGDPDFIKRHLETCEKCRARLENLKDMPAITLPDVNKIKELLFSSKPITKPQQAPEIVEFGQVWITKNQFGLPNNEKYTLDVPLTVVITLGEKDSYDNRDEYKNIRVATVSEMSLFASDRDLLLDAKEPPLYTKAMIELWNEIPTLKGVLQTYIGTLTDKAKEQLKLMLRAEYTHEELPVSIPRGFPIVDSDDPRVEFQAMEQRVTKRLSALSFQVIDEWEKKDAVTEEVDVKLKRVLADIEVLERENTSEAFNKILQNLDTLPKQLQNTPRVLLHRGFALYRLDNDKKALRLLQKAYKKAEASNDLQTACWASTRLAQYYSYYKKYTEGLTYIQIAKRFFKESYSSRLQAIMMRTEGDLLINTGKKIKGLNTLKKAIDYFRKANWPSQEIYTIYLYASQLADVKPDIFKKKKRYLKMLIRRFQERYDPMGMSMETAKDLAMLFAIVGDADNVIELFDNFVHQSKISNDDYADALLDVVIQNLRFINAQTAVLLLKHILKLVDTGYVANKSRIALSKYLIDKYWNIDEAINLCNEVLNDPGVPDLLSLYAKANIAALLLIKGNVEDAKKLLPEYEEAKRVGGDYKELLWLIKANQGKIFAMQEHYKEAAQCYREALKFGGDELMPDQKVITNCLYADVLLYFNKDKQANEVLNRLKGIRLQELPQHVKALYLLTHGVLLALRHRRKQAQKEIEKAKRIFKSLGYMAGVAISTYNLLLIALEHIKEIRNTSVDIPQIRELIKDIDEVSNKDEKPQEGRLSKSELFKAQADRIARDYADRIAKDYNVRRN
ncbi:MAG: hypothetical protein ACP5JP_09135, partial [bacterium]